MNEIFNFTSEMILSRKDFLEISAESMYEFFYEVKRMVAWRLHCTPLIININEVKLTPSTNQCEFDSMEVSYTVRLYVDVEGLKNSLMTNLACDGTYEIRRISFCPERGRIFGAHIKAVCVNGASSEEAEEAFNRKLAESIVQNFLISCIKPQVEFQLCDE